MFSKTLANGQLANVDPETGIHYGVISANSVNPDTLNWIYEQGDDVRYENAHAELVEDLKAFAAGKLAVKETELPGEVADAIGALADALMQDYESDGDSPQYYEDKETGVVVQTIPSLNCLWVFRSPVTKEVRECSPCFPNAGDLDSGDGPLKTYALPVDWLAKEESNDV